MNNITAKMKSLGYTQEMPVRNQTESPSPVALVTEQVNAAHDQVARLSQAVSMLESRLEPVLSFPNLPPSSAQTENQVGEPSLVASMATLLSQLQALWYLVDNITDRVRI